MAHRKNFKDVEIMKDPQGFFRKGERESIYDSCDTYRDQVLIRLLWKTGRRISEILELKVGDIRFDEKLILWNIKKKKVKDYRRWKPIDTKTLNLLAFCIKEFNLGKKDYMITGIHPNKHLSRQRAFQIVRRLCEKAGVEYVGGKKPHPHHFRHSFAVDMAKRTKSAADIRKVQLLMEHSNLGMTEQYLQFGALDLRDLIERGDEE